MKNEKPSEMVNLLNKKWNRQNEELFSKHDTGKIQEKGTSQYTTKSA